MKMGVFLLSVFAMPLTVPLSHFVHFRVSVIAHARNPDA